MSGFPFCGAGARSPPSLLDTHGRCPRRHRAGQGASTGQVTPVRPAGIVHAGQSPRPGTEGAGRTRPEPTGPRGQCRGTRRKPAIDTGQRGSLPAHPQHCRPVRQDGPAVTAWPFGPWLVAPGCPAKGAQATRGWRLTRPLKPRPGARSLSPWLLPWRPPAPPRPPREAASNTGFGQSCPA